MRGVSLENGPDIGLDGQEMVEEQGLATQHHTACMMKHWDYSRRRNRQVTVRHVLFPQGVDELECDCLFGVAADSHEGARLRIVIVAMHFQHLAHGFRCSGVGRSTTHVAFDFDF